MATQAEPATMESKGVLVVIEQHDGVAQPVSWELLGQSRTLADKLGCPVQALLMGHSAAGEGQAVDLPALGREAIARGADTVYLYDHPSLRLYRSQPYAMAMLHAIRTVRPEIVLVGATCNGRDLAGAVATRVPTGLTADCTMLDVEPPPSRLLLASRPAFGEKLMATIACKRHRPQMATARPGVFQALPSDPQRQGQIVPLEVALDEAQVAAQVLQVLRENDRPRLDTAPVIVAGGRGAGAAGFALLQELAALLGGEVAGTRAAAEAGWIGRDRQVGQTGQTVHPKLYLACGVSGATQHLVGMERSECIVAINRDPSAPIFQVADIGIVGDVLQVVPALIREARQRRERHAA